MENQPTTNPTSAPSQHADQLAQPPISLPSKGSLVIPLVLTAVVCATVFGIGGYYLGRQYPVAPTEAQQPTTQPSTQPAQATSTSPSPSITTNMAPSSSPKPSEKLNYSLPPGWKTLADTSGRLEVGYDPSRYDATAKNNEVDLSGKWVGAQGTDLRRLGWNKSFYLTAYNGGSRHSELYKILGITTSTSDWKSPEYYSEKEYSYNGWNCLIINGVNISQSAVAWGYCPISGTEALVLSFDGYDWSEIEQQLTAVRLTNAGN